MNKQELKTYLETTFPNCKTGETFDFPVLIISKEELLTIASQLKESKETLFDFLFCQTAVDYHTHFEVVYHLTSITLRHDMVLKVVLEKTPELESVYPIWKAADLYENEIYDMFGIRFLNHPSLRRIMLGEEFKGYPMRKDFVHEE